MPNNPISKNAVPYSVEVIHDIEAMLKEVVDHLGTIA